MKKIIITILLSLVTSYTFGEGAYYLVTAYYSPEAGQDFYLHDTYEEELKING